MTGKEYQELAMRTNDGGCFDHLADTLDNNTFERELDGKQSPVIADLLNGVIGLCGESGEVADIVKKAVFLTKAEAEARLKELQNEDKRM
ncbi:MAG: hypothetical protein ACLUFN_07615 [Eubacterium sp.]